MKTNWSEVVHEVTGRRHAKTLSEKEKEVSRLFGIIEEQQKQLEVALALTDAEVHVTKITKIKGGPGGSAVAFAIASDWHVEETVDPNTVNGLNAYNRMEDGTFVSIAYDRMMGGHFFDHLLAPVLATFPSLGPEDFRGPCREEFARLFPGHQRYLPPTVHYFSEERDSFGKPLYEHTGQPPEWRP